MDLIASLKVALGELLIKVVARISVPNEARDFYKKLTIPSEPGIASLQESEGGAANARPLSGAVDTHVISTVRRV